MSSERPEDAAARSSVVTLQGEAYRAAMAELYAKGATPWDSGVPNSELLRALDAGELTGTTVLEVGCGTGTNAVELARRGFSVTAIDLVDEPIRRAKEKARSAGVDVTLLAGDLTRAPLGGPFDSVFDCGLYHGIRRRDLAGFLATLARVTRPGTRWLSLAGNAREVTPDGPPVVTEEEIRRELGGLFRIVRMHEFRFELGPTFRPLGWSTLLERL